MAPSSLFRSKITCLKSVHFQTSSLSNRFTYFLPPVMEEFETVLDAKTGAACGNPTKSILSTEPQISFPDDNTKGFVGAPLVACWDASELATLH